MFAWVRYSYTKELIQNLSVEPCYDIRFTLSKAPCFLPPPLLRHTEVTVACCVVFVVFVVCVCVVGVGVGCVAVMSGLYGQVWT